MTWLEQSLIMKKSLSLAALLAAAGAAFGIAAPAHAGTHWSVNVGVGGFYPPAVYAPPAPYSYYAPPPVIAPAPVYVQPYPQPVYVRPYVYGGGYYPAPRYIAPPVYYHRGYRHYREYRR
jgi:hypothetical protein